MVILGVDILGNLNKPALSRASLGSSFWQLVTSSGIMVITFGFLNIATVCHRGPLLPTLPRRTSSNHAQSYIFRDTSRAVTARQVRAKGAVAVVSSSTRHFNLPPKGSTDSIEQLTALPLSNRLSRWAGLGKRPTLPTYHTSPVPSSHYSLRNSMESQEGLKISGPLEIDTNFAHLVRPDSAFHPSKRMSTA